MTTSSRRAALERWLARAEAVVEEQQLPKDRAPVMAVSALGRESLRKHLRRKNLHRDTRPVADNTWSRLEPRDDDVA